MDPPTHALLGATIGQAFFAPSLGRRALWWGALAAALPDADMLAVAAQGPWGEVVHHRGMTHALWFGPVLGTLAGYLVWRIHGRRGDPGPLAAWIGLFVLALLSHPLLDLFTTYGTQLLSPFAWTRFSLDAVAIIDPAYSLILIAALVVGWLPPRFAAVAAMCALAASTSYLAYGMRLNERAEALARAELARDGIEDAQVSAYPTIFQLFLRRVVARTGGDTRVGLVSMWRPERILWERFVPERHPLIDALLSTPQGDLFVWFAMGEVTGRVRQDPEGWVVELEDLRWGYPGQADRGIWGIRAHYDDAGRLRGSIDRFLRPQPPMTLYNLGTIWRSTWDGPDAARPLRFD